MEFGALCAGTVGRGVGVGVSGPMHAPGTGFWEVGGSGPIQEPGTVVRAHAVTGSVLAARLHALSRPSAVVGPSNHPWHCGQGRDPCTWLGLGFPVERVPCADLARWVGRKLSTVWWTGLSGAVGLVGCRHGLEHTFDQRSRKAHRVRGTLAELARQDPDRLADGDRAGRVLVLRGLLDRLEGHGLREWAAVDAAGLAGAEQGSQAPHRRVVAGPVAQGRRHHHHGGADRPGVVLWPLAATAAALLEGALSPAPARVLAHGTHDLPNHLTAEAEPVLLEAASRLGRVSRMVWWCGGCPARDEGT